MHRFIELIDGCATFTLDSLRDANERTIASLQTSGATPLVKTLQMIALQKTVLAVGMFSLFDATLQDWLKCKNGFDEAERILELEKEASLKELFNDFHLAINVLKHGRGRSYDALVARATAGLPFTIKLPGESFFDEGDVSEISTLIQVDDSFVRHCSDVIRRVFEIVRRNRPDLV